MIKFYSVSVFMLLSSIFRIMLPSLLKRIDARGSYDLSLHHPILFENALLNLGEAPIFQSILSKFCTPIEYFGLVNTKKMHQ